MTFTQHAYLGWLAAGFAVGYLFWDQSAHVKDLEKQIDTLTQAAITQENKSRALLAKSKFIDDFANRSIAEKASSYKALFEDLGISELEEKMFDRMRNIFRKSCWTEDAIAELIQARQHFQTELKSDIGLKAYDRIVSYERSQPSRDETKRFTAYLSAKGNSDLKAAEQNTIATLIESTSAYTTVNSWHGPFDGLPDPNLGAEDGIASLDFFIVDLQDRSEALVKAAEEAGLSEELIDSIRSYFGEALVNKKETLQRIAMGVEHGEGGTKASISFKPDNKSGKK